MTKNSIIKHGVRGLFATGLVATLVACGGGSSSSSDDSSGGSVPVAARGVITQLGSIYVTGCRYVEAPGGTYKSDDGEPILFDDYKVGQMVSIKGKRNDDGVSCVADEVEYEAEIEGTADNDGKINGITVLQTSNTNAPGIPAQLQNLERYEVSGVWLNDLTIEATFIKEDDDGGTGDLIDEIKGEVQVINSPSSFDVKDITFNMAGAAPHGLTGGEYVEVHFDNCAGTAPDLVCTASLVEIEDDIFDQAEGMEIEFEGAVDLDVSSCPPGVAEFKVDGICIDSSSKPAEWMDGLTEFADLVEGSRVEAEGHMVGTAPNNYLRADKIKGRGNRVRVSSIAENVVAGPPCTFTLVDSKISVEILDCGNAFEGDHSGGGALTIGNLDGEEVEVRGIRTGDSSMMALRVKESGLSGSGDRHEIRAEVDLDGADTSNDTLTVMGIVSDADACTEIEIGDMVVSGDEVCDTTLQGIDDFLTLVDDDTNAVNGPRDIVEIGFEITSGSGTDIDPYLAEEWEIEEEDD
jgi:hypothetical protein